MYYKKYETQYVNILENILKDGFEQVNERTGVGTLRIPNAIMTINLENEFPILKSKKVYWKSALKEILWIMQSQSNKISDLDSHIWDKWADENGTIGKAYGYQISKPININVVEYPNQVDYILKTLEKDTSDRRCVIDLWNVDDLGEMNLTPCCYSSIWNIIDNKLNCMLIQRSADFLVGVPFNTTQYAMLMHLFASHLGVTPGILTHCMADTHIYTYDIHPEGASTILKRYRQCLLSQLVTKELFKEDTEIYASKPTFVVPENKNFFDIKLNELDLVDYKSYDPINFDVAV